jgi:hypothetical protein
MEKISSISVANQDRLRGSINITNFKMSDASDEPPQKKQKQKPSATQDTIDELDKLLSQPVPYQMDSTINSEMIAATASFQVRKTNLFLRIMEFLTTVCRSSLVFAKEGIYSCGSNDGFSYAYKVFFERTFFEAYEMSRPIEMFANVEMLCKTLRDLKRNFKVSEVIIEKSGRDLLIHDKKRENERCVDSLDRTRNEISFKDQVWLDRLEYKYVARCVSIETVKLHRALNKGIPASVKRIKMSIYVQTHVLVEWDQTNMTHCRCRFPVRSENQAGRSSGCVGEVNFHEIERDVDPSYSNYFDRKYVSLLCRATGVNDYVKIHYPDPSCMPKETPILMKMKFHHNIVKIQEESYMKMWISPCDYVEPKVVSM